MGPVGDFLDRMSFNFRRCVLFFYQLHYQHGEFLADLSSRTAEEAITAPKILQRKASMFCFRSWSWMEFG